MVLTYNLVAPVKDNIIFNRASISHVFILIHFVRILEYCPPGPLFTIMCIIVRTVEACGTAGYSTASYAIMVNTFPDKAASMMVSQCQTFTQYFTADISY